MALVQTKDMTAGNPVKLILIFALPILAGNMLQQLYSLVDSADYWSVAWRNRAYSCFSLRMA